MDFEFFDSSSQFSYDDDFLLGSDDEAYVENTTWLPGTNTTEIIRSQKLFQRITVAKVIVLGACAFGICCYQ